MEGRKSKSHDIDQRFPTEAALDLHLNDGEKPSDGTLENVGIKMDDGKFKSPVTNQNFPTQEALDAHLKCINDPERIMSFCQFERKKISTFSRSCFILLLSIDMFNLKSFTTAGG